MIPDATAIANSGSLVTASTTAYPILGVVIAFVVVLGFGITLVVLLRRAVPKGGR